MNKHIKESELHPITVMVSLDQLIHGSEYPGGSVNTRIAYREQDIEQLAHSLQPHHDGQLKPLLCCTHPSKPNQFFVFDGGRRYTAFGFGVKNKLLESSQPIEIKDFGQLTPEMARQLSWAANKQVPLHPADDYHAFAQMNAGGATSAEIAKERGMTVRAVEQSLAFGNKLAPEILDAWRAGEITKDLAQIFTVGEKDEQAEQLDLLRKKHKRRDDDWATGALVEDELRKALAGNQDQARKLLKFVGEADYIAAGGRITQDLFDEKGKDLDVVQDIAKIKKLAKQKLKVKADALLADGWSWVDIQLTPHFLDYNYDKSKDKKKAGCVVRIAGTKIEVKSGLVKRGRGGPVNANASPAAKEAPQMNYAAEQAIDEARNMAAGLVLKTMPNLALAAVAAAFVVGRTGYGAAGPIAIQFDGGDHEKLMPGVKAWDDAFAKCAKLDLKALAAIIAAAMPDLVRMEDGGNNRVEKALLDRLDAKAFTAAQAKAFDAGTFFGGCSRPFLLAIIQEALGAEEMRKVEAKDQPFLAKLCTDSVAPKGWLPKELRSKLYAGPVAKTQATKAAVKAKAKPTTKKKGGK